MDTGSHLLFGATLAGLAYIDPAVAGHSGLAAAVFAGTLIGSHAPDFDALTRLKSYAAYVRHHRGVTHSLPALVLWPLAIALPLAFGFGVAEYWHHLYAWTFAAVFFHVFLDLFNAYGVQCFRPLSKRWFHLDVLALFEPFLCFIHVGGLALWAATDLDPARVFIAVYGATFLYIAVRICRRRHVIRLVFGQLQLSGACHLLPCLNWFRWQFVLETDRHFYTGRVLFGSVRVEEVFAKEQNHRVIEATKGTDGVRAFLHFAQNVHVSFTERDDGYEVRWRDVRFWYDHKLPFGADVRLDRNLNVVSDSIGWNKRYWDPPYV